MKVHHVVEEEKLEHVIDPEHGHVARKVKAIRTGSSCAIAHDGETYEADETGTFDLPPELAAEMLAKPGWYEGENPLPVEPREEEKKPAGKKAPAKA